MKKVLIVIMLVVAAPFLLLLPVIGAASSVSGFYDYDSEEDFNVESFKTSAFVQNVKAWYAEYMSEYEEKMNDRKMAVEKENTTIETVEKQKSRDETQEDDTTAEQPDEIPEKQVAVSVHKLNDSKFTEITVDEPDNPSDEKEASRDENEDTERESEPESGEQETQELETEQIEVCHVNVIIEMGDFPISAALAYYNVLFIKRLMVDGKNKQPKKDDIKAMLAAMTEYSESRSDNSDDYYITMNFRPYEELTKVMFNEWTVSDDELLEYSERYLNVTEMIAGWFDEDLSAFDKGEDAGE